MPIKGDKGMKLAPHQILRYLGFDVPAEGIEIHPREVYLHVESLRVLGTTIDVSAIPDSALSDLCIEYLLLLRTGIDVSSIHESALSDMHAGFVKLIEAWQGEEPDNDILFDASVSDWLRALIASNLTTIYKQRGKREQVATMFRSERGDSVIIDQQSPILSPLFRKKQREKTMTIKRLPELTDSGIKDNLL
jgi:hypothetical protein